jgi:hypothetical protein
MSALAIVLGQAGMVAAAGSIMFDTRGTSDKPQSKLWYNDDLWWCCIDNLNTLAIYKLSGGTWTKKVDVQAAVIPNLKGGTADCLWDGTHLFIAAYGSSTSKIYKYTYDAVNQTYVLMAGFPVSLTMLANSETIVIDEDSTGRLWATYEANGKIQVTYSTSADHTQWLSTPLAISGTVDPDDISTIVAFGGNTIGVLWSDQRVQQVCFRTHLDSDPPGTWGATEVVRSGFGVVDDHINLKADSQGHVYFAAKDFFDGVWVGRRNLDGTWTVTTGASGLDCGTRPILQIDEAGNKLYVFYTRWESCVSTGNHAIEERVAYLDNLLFSLPTVVIDASNVSMNEVQGTKQLLLPGALAILCEGTDGKAYWTGWGALSGIGGVDPGGVFPPPPAPPGNLTAQTITESPQSRLLLWRLDETSGTTASDASGNSRTGNFGSGLAAPHWASGVVNNGLFFDGDDYISAGTTSSLAFVNKSFTLEAWVKIDLTNAPGTGRVFGRGDVLHSNYRLDIVDPTIEFGWSVDDTTDTKVKANKSLRDGLWHHLAAVWNNSTATARIFVDGHLEVTKTLVGPTFGNSWPMTCGALPNGGLVDKTFAGTLDLVSISSSALYSSDFTPPLLYPSSTTKYARISWSPVTSVAGISGYRLHRRVNGGSPVQVNATPTPNRWYADFGPPSGFLDYGVLAIDGLTQTGSEAWTALTFDSSPPSVCGAPQSLASTFAIATADVAPFWEFDEGSGSTTQDGSLLGHDAQLGAAAVGDNAEPTWVNGVTGKALHFDGSNDYALVADANDLRFTGSFTIEAWVRRSVLGVAHAIIAKDEGSSKRNYLALILSNGQIEFSWRDIVASSTRKATSSNGITDNAWHHVACVYDAGAGQSRVYIDGTQAASSSTSGTPYTGPESVRFGARGASSGGGAISDPLNGDVDLVRITNGVRYTGSFTPPDLLHGGAKKLVVHLTWGLPTSGLPKDYKVYRQELPSGSNTLIATQSYTVSPLLVDSNVQSEHTYRYTVLATNSSNVAGPASAPLDVEVPVPTDVASEGPPAARALRLRLEPNPFNPQALASFRLERAGPVDLALYDAGGRRVRVVLHGVLPAGDHRAPIARPGDGRLASGVYFLRLRADGHDTKLKAVLVQ